MNPNLAAILAQDPHIFEPLHVIIECEHLLIDELEGPGLDGRTTITITNETTDNSVSVMVPNKELPALHDAITTHLKEATQ